MAKWAEIDLTGGLTPDALCVVCRGPNLEVGSIGLCECRDCGEEMSVEEANEMGSRGVEW